MDKIRKLYKYRALDTKIRIEQVHDIIVNHRLYCAPADSFNDPFEFKMQISLDAPEQIKTEMAIKQLRIKHPDFTLEKVRTLAQAFLDECERNGHDRIKQRILNDYGIVSFTGILQNILMWSHYADGHKGICIEFCYSNKVHLDFFAKAHTVNYSKITPVINPFTEDMLTIGKKLLSKSIDWRYEQEYRIIELNRNQNQYYEFEPTLMSKIYLGLRISEENIQKIKSFVSEIPQNVRPILMKANPSSSSYSFEFKQIE
jgi:hypothetical protein